MEYLRAMRKVFVRLIALIMVLSASVSVFGQDFEELRLKKWSADDPITWDDLSVRHLPDGLKEYARIVTEEDYHYESIPFMNTTVSCRIVDESLNRVLSWYDPDHCDEWTLRYLQVMFNIEQYEGRILGLKNLCIDIDGPVEVGYNINPRSCLIDDDLFFCDSITADRFMKESNYGRDTAVILEYEQRYNISLMDSLAVVLEEKLDELAGQYEAACYYFELDRSIGYSNESYLGPVGQGIGALHGVSAGWTVYLGRLMSALQFSWMGNCAADNRNIVFDLGCLLYDGYKVSVTPFVGVGQSLLKRHPDYSGRTGAVRYEAGFMVDWNNVNQYSIMHVGGVKLKTRLKVFGAMSDYKPFRESYSVNIGLQFTYSMFGYGSLILR